MNSFEKRQWARLICCVLAVIAATLFLTGIIGGKEMTYQLPAAQASGTAAIQETAE